MALLNPPSHSIFRHNSPLYTPPLPLMMISNCDFHVGNIENRPFFGGVEWNPCFPQQIKMFSVADIPRIMISLYRMNFTIIVHYYVWKEADQISTSNYVRITTACHYTEFAEIFISLPQKMLKKVSQNKYQINDTEYLKWWIIWNMLWLQRILLADIIF